MAKQEKLTHVQQMIADLEAIKYKYVWENCEDYGRLHHDMDLWERRRNDYSLEPGATIIVLGCGDGSLVRHLDGEGFNVCGVDIYSHPFWAKPMSGNDDQFGARRMFIQQALWDPLPIPEFAVKWDLAICADVMEHIPEELLGMVLQNINESCSSALFQIANMTSKFDGHNLHMIHQGSDWWRSMLGIHLEGPYPELPDLVDDDSPASRFVIRWDGK